MGSLVRLLLIFIAYSLKMPSPCDSMTVKPEGIYYPGGMAPFPLVYISKTEKSKTLTSMSVDEEMPFFRANGKEFQNIRFSITLKPYLRSYQLSHLPEIWKAWGGSRVPYTAKWQLTYTLVDYEDGERAEEYGLFTGDILPSCVNAVKEELVADADFNDTPRAFWNTNIKVVR